MRVTRLTCFKNSDYTAFLLFISEMFDLTVSLKDCAMLVKLFTRTKKLQSTSSFAEVSDFQEYEKRRWFDDYARSIKNDSEIRKDGFNMRNLEKRGKELIRRLLKKSQQCWRS